jgi:hypothetical protein
MRRRSVGKVDIKFLSVGDNGLPGHITDNQEEESDMNQTGKISGGYDKADEEESDGLEG